MNSFFLAIYLVSFCLLVGGAFGLMYANIRAINMKMDQIPKAKPSKPPSVIYVDSSPEATRERLENLYND